MENNIKDEKSNSSNNKISLSLAIVFSAIIISGAIMFSGKDSEFNQNNSTQNGKLDLVGEVTEEDFLRGQVNADVTIIEYADFSCGYCGVYHPILKRVVEEYEGKVSWVYRHLPIFNIEAAVASECVGEIGGDDKFWSFADNLYQNRNSYSGDYYKKVAIELGINEEEYDVCISNPLVKSSIQRDFSQNKILLGFNATPYSVIIDKNGKKFSFAGALSYEELKSVIDKILQ